MPDFRQVLEKTASGKLVSGERELGLSWQVKHLTLSKSYPVSSAIYARGPIVDWLAIHEQMHDVELPVPEVYDFDLERGHMLIEDIGEKRVVDLPANASQKRFDEAAKLIIQMQSRLVPGKNTGLLPYCRTLDEPTLIAELDSFVDETLPKWFAVESKGTHLEPVRIEFARLARDLAALPRLFSHRSFAGRNLHVTPAKRLVITGFEGALMAPPHYDLVSMLYDGWGHPNDKQRKVLKQRHAEAGKSFLPAWDEETSRRAFDRVALQRLIGEFGRIARRYESKAEMEKAVTPVLNRMIASIRHLLRESHDLDRLRDALVELVPAFDPNGH